MKLAGNSRVRLKLAILLIGKFQGRNLFLTHSLPRTPCNVDGDLLEILFVSKSFFVIISSQKRAQMHITRFAEEKVSPPLVPPLTDVRV